MKKCHILLKTNIELEDDDSGIAVTVRIVTVKYIPEIGVRRIGGIAMNNAACSGANLVKLQ